MLLSSIRKINKETREDKFARKYYCQTSARAITRYQKYFNNKKFRREAKRELLQEEEPKGDGSNRKICPQCYDGELINRNTICEKCLLEYLNEEGLASDGFDLFNPDDWENYSNKDLI